MHILVKYFLVSILVLSQTSKVSTANEVTSENLWAGLATYGFDRWAPDACGYNPISFASNEANYDDWVRQRASIRSVCFQVWAPGVTDTESSDYWLKLDVKYELKIGNQTYSGYVNSDGQRGNNRRYRYSIDQDPLLNLRMLGHMPSTVTVISQDNRFAYVSVPADLTFSINGHKLNANGNMPFRINYTGNVYKTQVDDAQAPKVAAPYLKCDSGLSIGNSFGYYAVDITDPVKAEQTRSNLLAHNRYNGAVYKFPLDSQFGTSLTASGILASQGADTIALSNSDQYIQSEIKVKLTGTNAKLTITTKASGIPIKTEVEQDYTGCALM